MLLARAEKADLSDGGSPSRPGSSLSPSGSAPMPPGGVFFVTATRQREACAELRARRYLVVAAPNGAPPRGGLRLAIDDAVEGALALRGALPPGAPIGADVEATVRDQLLRARALGTAGIALSFPPLPSLAAAEDAPLMLTAAEPPALDLEDGALVSGWIAAAQRGSVVVLFNERDRDTSVLAPRRLAEIASSMKAPIRAERLASSDAQAALTKDSVPPSGEVEKAPVEPMPATIKEGGLGRPPVSLCRPKDKLSGDDDPPTQRYQQKNGVRRGVLQKRPRLDLTAVLADAAGTSEAEELPAPTLAAPEHERSALKDAAPLKGREVRRSKVAPILAERRAAVESSPAAVEPAPGPVEAATPEDSPPAMEPANEDSPPDPEVLARRIVNAATLRAHAVELDKARGPKPVSVLEKLFTTRYMPLLGALARGEVDAGVKSVIDAFRTNFEHSYREAFSALRVTGKRPPMVFDAPDIASRIGRLNGARAVKLLLVDAMRFDIGERVAARLCERLAGRAVCVERSLLWAAIPTTTPTQMTLLARGQEGLREAEPPPEPEAEIARGRAVGTVRRERIGAREVMKLDVVEARLRGAGAGYEDRIESIAEEVTQITARYIETLPPRTLLFLFGDHGFRLPASPDGRATGSATQGGVSPEEVLVPAHAFLVGGVH